MCESRNSVQAIANAPRSASIKTLKVYSLTFEVSETDADTIEDFLDARGGVESFDFTPPGDTSTSKYICRDWNKSIPYLNRATIQATFEQVFEA